MSFNDKKRDGKIIRVKSFDWSNGVPIACNEGNFLNNGSVPAMRVNKRKRFRLTQDEGDYTEKVTGRFTKRHEAKGTIRVQGDLDGHTGCDTGKLHWSASDL